jgi:hypothetical protein
MTPAAVGRSVICSSHQDCGRSRITITSGSGVSQHGGNTWHVPKSVLISTLEIRMHSKQLKIAAALAEAGPLKEDCWISSVTFEVRPFSLGCDNRSP